jgi:soluble lytic murein transglycosylase-like protein
MANKLTISTQLTWASANGYMPAFSAAARQTGVPRNLLLAVASRESCIGMCLDDFGLGDHGNAIGLMQIDKRYHPDFANGPLTADANVLKGAQILKKELDHYGGDKKTALAAYNAGEGGVSRATFAGNEPDSATTGGNYGADVLSRYAILQQMSGSSPSDAEASEGGGPHGAGSRHLPENAAEKLTLMAGGSLIAAATAFTFIWKRKH